MARLQQDSSLIVLNDIQDPVNDQDAATKAYVDANGGGSDLTAGTGITITDDTINIATGGVDTVQLAAGAVDTNRLGDDAVSEAKIADIAVKERHLDITNTPTAGQILTSATDTTQFTWADAGGITDYNDAPFGNFDEDGSITWTFNETGDPSSQGEVSFTDSGDQGYTLRFRTADVDTINSVSVNFFQIGFGSPIAFATYAVADLVIADDFVDVSVINGPLDGDDVLATFPADNTALSIIVSVSQFRLPLSSLEDVNIPTPVGTHGLIYDGTNNEWVSSETVNQIADGGHIDVSTVAGVATLTFDETFDLWQKNDWVQINTGTPDFAADEILWEDATETLTVPSLNGRTLENILLSARTGMGIQIRRQQTNVDPVGFTSGFYQILSISASVDDDQVVVQLLPDETDIFNEPAGGTFTYELVVLQFITGGTLNNLTLEGLADISITSVPDDNDVLTFNTTNNLWEAAPQTGGGGGGAEDLHDLNDVTITDSTLADGQLLTFDNDSSQWINTDAPDTPSDISDLDDVSDTAATADQILSFVIPEGQTDGLWTPIDLPDGSTPDLGDLGDVNTNGVADGFLIRYDGPNSNYRAHSVSNTVAVYGGLISNRDGTLVTPIATGLNALAVGNDTEATGEDSIAIGIQAEGTAEAAIAIGAGATATQASTLSIGELTSADHANSTAIGEGAGTDNNNELRLGSYGTHVTVATSVAGNESEDNQLVSKRWVNNQISDASRVVSSTANAIENLTVVTESTPWDTYRVVPGNGTDQTLQVHMYEFDATESQFIFYPGFMSNAFIGNGTNLTINDTPDFFEEVTNIGNEAEVTDAAGDAVTSLGWKYLGHDTAIVWQAVSHVYTFDFEWLYPISNSDGVQNPPDVTSSLELVRLKPTGVNTYDMATNATVIASSPTSFHNAGSLSPGGSESFTGSYEFAQQELADGISNVENGDVFAYRMKIRYKGDGFDGATNVRLSITESETSNIVPQIGIRHVGRDYSLTLEDSGDLQWTDHGSAIETDLVLVENTADGPIIPAASLGLIAGDNITITGKTISSSDSQTLTAGDGIDIVSDAISVDAGEGIAINASGVTLDFRTEANQPLEISGSGEAAGLSLRIDEDGPLQKTTNGLDVIIETNGGLEVGSLSSGIGINVQAGSRLSTSSEGLNWAAELADLTDVATTDPTEGQILHWNATAEEWEPTSLAPGTDLTFNNPLSVNASDVVTLNRGAGLFLDSSNSLAVNPGTGINVSTADGVSLNAAIGDLNDVNTTTKTPTEGQFLSYDNTDGEWVPVDGISDLSDLSDVSNTAPSNGQALVYNNSTSLWTPAGVGEEYVAINFSSGDSTPDIGLNNRAVGIGPDTVVSGVAGIALGWNSNAGGALGIAIGERATVSDTRGIAIGSSTDSSDSSADLVQATGEQSIAIGRAARATNTNALAIGDDTRALTTDTTAIGASAQVTGSATGSTAIGHNATASLANTTVLGSGTSHRVFAGSRELSTVVNESGDANSVSCSINNDFWQTPNNGFNPSSTSSEILRYTQVGDLAIGRFDYRLALDEDTAFQEGDRWTCNTTSADMLDAFGYNVGSSAIALGTFVISGNAYNSAAMGDFWLHPDSTTALIRMSFRVRSVIGTAPPRDSYISAQFNIAKF